MRQTSIGNWLIQLFSQWCGTGKRSLPVAERRLAPHWQTSLASATHRFLPHPRPQAGCSTISIAAACSASDCDSASASVAITKSQIPSASRNPMFHCASGLSPLAN